MMHFKKLFFILLSTLVLACTQPNERTEIKDIIPLTSSKITEKALAEQPQIPIYDSRCFVLYSADTTVLNRFRKEMGEDEFYTAADDNVYYSSEVKAFLESKGENLIHTFQRRFKFKSNTGRVFEKNIPPEYWSMLYMFDGQNAPIEADMTGIDSVYDDYIKKGR